MSLASAFSSLLSLSLLCSERAQPVWLKKEVSTEGRVSKRTRVRKASYFGESIFAPRSIVGKVLPPSPKKLFCATPIRVAKKVITIFYVFALAFPFPFAPLPAARRLRLGASGSTSGTSVSSSRAEKCRISGGPSVKWTWRLHYIDKSNVTCLFGLYLGTGGIFLHELKCRIVETDPLDHSVLTIRSKSIDAPSAQAKS
ncbi:hypothetical protein B0H17DRAFT_1182079 [Mycena rosella]|uniref:Secreted protein n=1 Tax=Mycena rosella TaxID=1033263 RepID=A0AAD7G9P6_MYCRO|nr:hypothetical protein B0H17DRAFT_1182079 [Mycena rosella]